MKRMAALLLTLAILFSFTACGKKSTCPMCDAKADFSTQIFCSNCGYDFGSMKPDGYYEEPPMPDESLNSEESGVPDVQIHADIAKISNELSERADSVSYIFEHNVDLTTHADTIIAEISGKTNYGIETDIWIMHYQYYKSDDLWKLIDSTVENCYVDMIEENILGRWTRNWSDGYNIDKGSLCLDIYEFDGDYALVSITNYENNGDTDYIVQYEYLEVKVANHSSDNHHSLVLGSSNWWFEMDLSGVSSIGLHDGYMTFASFS